MKDSPAYKAGIKAGDKILKIDETVTTDLSVDEAIKLIRGDIGTKVTITILRGEELAPREFTIVRQSIEIPTLDTEKRSDGIFVVRLYNFSANSSELFKKAMTEFKSSNYKKLILDLRGNPGGYLESAVDMASYFLKEGEVIVRESSNDKKDEEVFKSKGYNIFGDKSKFVILVDGGSASASEILAGALSEQGVATMIGEKTYGKGSVQELLPVTNDTSIKITVANWYTPNGVSISKNGLEPNIVSTFTDEDIKNKVDTQFERAVEFINKGK
jgi:carboxyl-terminal processing protease